MKYAYVAISAVTLASTVSAAPLGFFGSQSETLNENAGIVNGRGLTSTTGLGNDIEFSNVNLDGSPTTSIFRRLLNFDVGETKETENENGGIVNGRRSTVTNLGVGNGDSGASNVDLDGDAHITITERSTTLNEGLGNGNSGASNVDVVGSPTISISRRGNVLNEGVGNGDSGATNVDLKGSPYITISRRDVENLGVGNGDSGSTNVDLDGNSHITISERGDVSNIGIGNGDSDSTNVDLDGSPTISISRRLLNFDVGETKETENENAGIINGRSLTTNLGVGNGLSGSSNVDLKGNPHISISKRLISAGSSSTTENENGGIVNVDPEEFQAMMAGKEQAQRRGNVTNLGVGNGDSGSSNVDLDGDAHITISERDLQNLGVGNGLSGSSNVGLKGNPHISISKRLISAGSSSTTENENGGIVNVDPEEFQAMMAGKESQTASKRGISYNADILA
ncbi:hypothetical protein CBS101457_003888 [Exobasidium rhododendri]|nr:hypothetical protein CBS101457_003888 [Exobasidium rhododendri]